MMAFRLATVTAALAGLCTLTYGAATPPRATLTAAPAISLPGTVDSNSPVMWDLEDGQQRMFVMTSHSGVPSRSAGSSLSTLTPAVPIDISPHPGYGVWMEAIVSDEVDTWYGYYHNEWPAARCGRDDRAVPRIGAARSTNRGRTWQDLGVIIQARRTTTACDSPNRYVIGGVGDLSVMLDHDEQFLYFFYSQYPEAPASQGVAVARMAWADRDAPWGQIEIWRNDIWDPDTGRREVVMGLPGQTSRRIEWTYPLATPLVAPQLAWHDADNKVDAFWGPAVHWNTALQQYVMLLNRAKDENYAQEGIYVSYAPRLDDPGLWTPPQRILSGGRWYPQVIGSTPGVGTDKIAGAAARFFMSGRSEWIINFSK
ncbi:MAG TPA: hypothetical protein VEC39_07265 [Vicinamibacterales bacterium]|nr:hypothetical protein [Vicinamibacterales bacterium]